MMETQNKKTVCIIPARLESSRLPGKALRDICGFTMIHHVYVRCTLAKTLDEIYVATDSEEIAQEVRSFNGNVIMTSSEHKTGTDRIAEAAEKIQCEIVVNVQGDEALVNPDYIDKVVSVVQSDQSVNVAILINAYHKTNNPSDIKTVVDENMNVMYFSRSDIPSASRTPDAPMYKACHIIPFRKNFLLQYAKWPKGKLESIEFNEYLRILEKGYKIRAVEVESDAVSVDTKDDLEFVRQHMAHDPYFLAYKGNVS